MAQTLDASVGEALSKDTLAAEAACRDVILAFIDCTDGFEGRRPRDIPQLFTDDCIYVTTARNPNGETLHGRAEVATYLEDREAYIVSQRFRHVVTNLHFTLDDPTHASTRTTLTTFALSDPQPFLVNCLQELRDSFVLLDGIWKIAKREYRDLARRDTNRPQIASG